MKKDKNIVPVFTTLAVIEGNDKYKDTNSANPSESAVKQAKDWVDENKL